MKTACCSSSSISSAVAAGLAGSAAQFAMRAFDKKYAPQTVPPTQQPQIDPSASFLARFALGIASSLIYARFRSRTADCSTLRNGLLLGAARFATDRLLTPPTETRFRVPVLIGEFFRQAAFGIVTVATLSALNRHSQRS